MLHYKLILLLGVVFTCVEIHAQDAITVSGGNATGSGGSLSYSIGQVAYTNHTSSSYNLEKGVQRAYEIEVLSEENHDEDFLIRAFPNPTTDILQIDLPLRISFKELRLFSSDGRLVIQSNILTQNPRLALGHLPVGVYLLHVLPFEGAPSTFKIVIQS